MGLKIVEKNIGFTWPFIAEDEVQIVEIDPNIMVFNFEEWDSETRPWNINLCLNILHHYSADVIYKDLIGHINVSGSR